MSVILVYLAVGSRHFCSFKRLAMHFNSIKSHKRLLMNISFIPNIEHMLIISEDHLFEKKNGIVLCAGIGPYPGNSDPLACRSVILIKCYKTKKCVLLSVPLTASKERPFRKPFCSSTKILCCLQ